MISQSVCCIAIAIGFCLIQPIDAFAILQDSIPVTNSAAVDSTQSKPPEQYLLTLSEYRLKGLDVSGLTAENITAAMMADKASPLETTMLTAIAGTENRVSFGRMVAVKTGRTNNRGGSSKNYVYRDIGTILSAIPTTEGQQVRLALNFKSSRVTGEDSEDSLQDTVTISMDINQLFELARPTLIGANTAGETSYLFLTVTRL